MARSSAAAPPPPTPFWEASSFRWGVAAAGVLGLLVMTGWLERVNTRYQVERRLREDPRLGPMVAELTASAEKNTAAGLPEAVWVGRVGEVVEGVVRDNHPQTSLIYLKNPMLLAGSAGKPEPGGKVSVAPAGYLFRGGKPQEGETWLIAVSRDKSGKNAIRHAERYAP